MRKGRYILMLLILILIPRVAFAQEALKVWMDNGVLMARGMCANNVNLDLYRIGNSKSVYSSGVECANKTLNFKDSLVDWNLVTGDYNAAITDTVTKRETSRFTITYTRPTDSIVQKSTDPQPDAEKKDSVWQAIEDIKNYVMAIDDRMLFMNYDIEASDRPDSVKLSAQGILVLMQEGTRNLLSLLDSLLVILTDPTSNLLSPVPKEGDDVLGDDLLSPLVSSPSPTPADISTPVPFPSKSAESSGSAILSL